MVTIFTRILFVSSLVPFKCEVFYEDKQHYCQQEDGDKCCKEICGVLFYISPGLLDIPTNPCEVFIGKKVSSKLFESDQLLKLKDHNLSFGGHFESINWYVTDNLKGEVEIDYSFQIANEAELGNDPHKDEGNHRVSGIEGDILYLHNIVVVCQLFRHQNLQCAVVIV